MALTTMRQSGLRTQGDTTPPSLPDIAQVAEIRIKKTLPESELYGNFVQVFLRGAKAGKTLITA